MAEAYELNGMRRFINSIMKQMTRWGIGPQRTYTLTVVGRKSGKPYSTPVSLVEQDGQRWLVAPYGEVSWVKNARVAGQVTLSRGGKSETVKIEEVDALTAAPILKSYIKNEAITRPYFDSKPDSPVEAFASEAHKHPVFRIGTAV